MLPSILAGQLQEGISDYLKTTFPMTTPVFMDSLDKMLRTKDSVFHKPYISVRLPFRIADDMQEDFFQSIHPKYRPYVHQKKAFERLTGEDGRSTLIATGTGSGKTECFIYPILEYCYRHRGEKGIKALIIYPMNALASDQAKRIAELIYESHELSGNVTAGMYVGGFEGSPSRAMSKDKIITDHETMLSSPPDILLTNYKMLDYLLVRPKDAALWKENNPETLKYIAVDEFHTFDGAQGTDLACLLRRLKSRLYTPVGHLCCIGTSATMGDKDSANNILNYASEVFGEPFESDAVVTEDRLSPDEFFSGIQPTDYTIPQSNDMGDLLNTISEDNQEQFLKASVSAWFNEDFIYDYIMSDETRLAIGKHLMEHNFTQILLHYMAGNYLQNDKICEDLSLNYPVLKELPEASTALDALFALISHARTGDIGKMRPFLNVQMQLWMRELRRLLAKVSEDDITYALASDLNEQQSKQYLPVVNCRDCGETGWVSIANERGNVKISDLSTFYNLYFKQDKKVVMMYPHRHDNYPWGMASAFLCSSCLQLDFADGEHHNCTSCGSETIPVIVPINQGTTGSSSNRGFKCPHCGSMNGLAIMGLRSATTISATISQMFASKFNDDKKTLAFSDNVQDAAHRAGFFNSRTWKFGLRSAIQRFALDIGNGLTLSKFSNKFVDYWHGKLSDEDFISRFIAPNMTWMRAYEKMKSEGILGQGQAQKNLMNNVEYRLRYEIMLEYGLTSRIGRTLEKSGCSVISFDSKEINSVATAVNERAINELGALKEFSQDKFERMVVGFLNIMRDNGAFNDKVFGTYTNNGGKSYLLTNDHEKWLPGINAARTPRFIYEPSAQMGKKLYAFDLVNGKYKNWVAECLDGYLKGDVIYENIAHIVLEELVKAKLVVSMPSPVTYKVWAINKDKTYISTEVQQFVCDTCGNAISVSKENAGFWNGAPCPRNNCYGTIAPDDNAVLNYYGKLYSSGDMVRIYAKEHTGLLERDERDEIEREFKRFGSEQKPWDANVLSCTPTLEMGIDIGDLSSVILCSIPPAQAQYLQRAGRAGRKDGNALTVSVANAKPHDLYFYADPMEMMAGNVEPPKIFLKASAVLERQFVAYCMDSWIKKGVPENVIPKNVGICITGLNSKSPNSFPFNFLMYVQNNLSGLLRTFIQMFSEYLDGYAKDNLKAFAQGTKLSDSPMHMKVLEAFEALKKQKDSLTESVKQLNQLIKEIEAKPKDSSYDEEIKELRSEKNALANVIRSLSNKDVFNFLSDEGLLPNYAFPEAGIVLKAVLYRREDEDEVKANAQKKKYEKLVYEYNRSASLAISEFAPSNNFYVDGRKLTINQVDLTTAQTAKWRLCPNCSHAQLEEAGKNIAACPQCGSPAWADSGQVRSMLKVQMLYSNMDYNKSFIGDESEERSTIFYCKQLLIDVYEDEDISIAYRMDNDEFCFGYEFVKKAVLREINFGESDVSGEHITIDGKEDVRKGFRICKYCGKIQPEQGNPEHSYTCKARNSQVGNNPYEEYLFLYREFTTEALRILVPATTMDSSKVRQESFTAAFMLGMREYFGNVDHLRACISEVPVQDSDYRKQYLVIYDSVPGGTGYLKQLMQQKHSLIEIFEKALFALEKCECKNDPQKDGCYHCLYAYRQSQNIGEISRSVAIKMLKQILSGKSNLEEIPKLGNIPVNSLFESELERRFIEALSQLGNESRPLSISKELVRNKEGYLLKIGQSVWEIEPQVVLDNQYGVPVTSRADFVLWPTRTAGDQIPVAIFTDGFLYHKDKVADDTLKREAIRRSGKFRVWVLSWKDVQEVFRHQDDYATGTLLPDQMPSGSKMYKPTIESFNAIQLRPDKIAAIELLAQYLELPDAEKLFAIHAKAYALSLLEPSCFTNSVIFADWNLKMSEMINALGVSDVIFEFGKTFFGKWTPRTSNSHITVYAGVQSTDMQKNKLNANVSVFSLLNDEDSDRTDKYEQEWNGFWHFFNMIQFLNQFGAVSAVGLRQMYYNSIPINNDQNISADAALDSTESNDWNETLSQIYDQGVKEFAYKCIRFKLPEPSTVGYELENSSGVVVGEAELVWENLKVALLLPEQQEYKAIFEDSGWKVLSLEDEINSKLFNGGTES